MQARQRQPPVSEAIVPCLFCLAMPDHYSRACAILLGCCTIMLAGLAAHGHPRLARTRELTPREHTSERLRLCVSQTHATLDAGVLFSALLLLGCHGMARGWPAQLGGVAGGGRAAALTRESTTVYAAAASSWKALCRAWMAPPLPAEATATS